MTGVLAGRAIRALMRFAQTGAELLDVITGILDAGRAAGDLRADVTAEDIAASLTGIFTVVGKPEQHAQATRLLDLLMDGLRFREHTDR